MKIVYLAKFYHSLEEILEYYREVDIQEGTQTVDRIKEEITGAINIISSHPKMCAVRSKNKSVRVCNLQKFPYGIFYVFQERKKTLQIINIRHHKRKPKHG